MMGISGEHDNFYLVKCLIVLLIISFAYSSMSVIADCFRLEGSLEPIVHFYGTTGNILLAIGRHALFVFALGLVLFLIWTSYGARSERLESERHIRIKTICLIALLLMLAWLPWMLSHYPGTVRDDTFPQMFQWYGKHDYYSQHPVADTLLFGFFFSIGDLLGSRTLGLFIYLIVQAAATAFVFSGILHYMWKHGVPSGLLLASFFFFAFSRVIYQPVDAMSKDSLNGIPFCLLALGIVEIIRTDTKVLDSKAFFGCFFTGVVLCVITKRTMQYVLLIVFAFCLIYFLIKRVNPIRFLLISFVPIIIGSSLVVPAINASVGARDNKTFEMYSIPAQQIVRVLIEHPDAVSEEEYDRLSRFIDIEEALDVYNYWRSDEVTGCIEDSSEFFSCLDIWVRLGISYPGTYFCAWLGMNANWFSLTESINYGHDTHAELLTKERVEGWRGFFESEREADEFLGTLDFSRIDLLEPLYSILEKIDLMQSDLYAVGSYGLYCTLLPLLLFAYSLIVWNGRMIIATIIPLALITSLFVGPIALYWYTVPMVYLAPLLLAIPIVLRDDSIIGKHAR